jgi:hypothetical protein
VELRKGHFENDVVGRMDSTHCIIRLVAAGVALPARARDAAARVLGAATLTTLEASGRLERRVHGSRVAFLDTPGGRRRILELSPDDDLVAVLSWNDAGALREAAVRIPDDRFVTIEPRALIHPQWGSCDQLWLGSRAGRDGGVPLVTFSAVDYADVRAIPTLGDPARLPPGAGTTVLNLIAGLAEDQRAGPLAYDGPYPTEQLFLALLESFRYRAVGETDGVDPVAAFMRGSLAWTPAPSERRRATGGIVVQLRDRVEKVIWDQRSYYRADWQTVERHAPRRVRDDGNDVVCSLWALGTVIEDHLRLSHDGEMRAVVAPDPATDRVRPMADAVRAGVVAAVAALSAPALAPFVRETARELSLAWAPVDRDLVAVEDRFVRVSPRLRTVAIARAREADDRAGAVEVVFALIGELTTLLGDTLRSRAQAALAARSDADQRAALDHQDDPEAAAASGLIGAAALALLADLDS